MANRPGFFDRVRAAMRGFQSGGVKAYVYAGAQMSRLTEDWIRTIWSADQEIKGDIRALRGAARMLVRDNAFASRYLNLLAENVIGPQGIRLQARVTTTRGHLNESLNEQIEDAWGEWCRAENASADGRLSFTDLTALVMQLVAQDGESLVRILRGADNEFGFALQLLDADQLDEQYDLVAEKSPTGNEIRMGVEVDRYGKPLAYWIWAEHPSDTRRRQKRERIDARDIIHLGLARRPGQTRFVSWFAPVMFDQKMLQAYQEAEVTAARIAASNMAAVQFDPDKADAMAVNAAESTSALPQEVQPGLFMRLGPGETLAATDFNHPSTAFPSFTKAIQLSIASGLNVGYCSLTGNLEAVNYSSIRAGLLSERDFYRRIQTWLASQLHDRVYREWAPLAALAGWFSAQQVTGRERIDWQPRGWRWVDPLNDVEAILLARDNGLTTFTQACGEMGADFEENLEAIKQENDRAAELGITLGGRGVPTIKKQPEEPAAGAPADPAADPSAPSTDPHSNANARRGRRPLLLARHHA